MVNCKISETSGIVFWLSEDSFIDLVQTNLSWVFGELGKELLFDISVQVGIKDFLLARIKIKTKLLLTCIYIYWQST